MPRGVHQIFLMPLDASFAIGPTVHGIPGKNGVFATKLLERGDKLKPSPCAWCLFTDTRKTLTGVTGRKPTDANAVRDGEDDLLVLETIQPGHEVVLKNEKNAMDWTDIMSALYVNALLQGYSEKKPCTRRNILFNPNAKMMFSLYGFTSFETHAQRNNIGAQFTKWLNKLKKLPTLFSKNCKSEWYPIPGVKLKDPFWTLDSDVTRLSTRKRATPDSLSDDSPELKKQFIHVSPSDEDVYVASLTLISLRVIQVDPTKKDPWVAVFPTSFLDEEF
jgi:hypothetical protein